jgi:hypothetical protein
MTIFESHAVSFMSNCQISVLQGMDLGRGTIIATFPLRTLTEDWFHVMKRKIKPKLNMNPT